MCSLADSQSTGTRPVVFHGISIKATTKKRGDYWYAVLKLYADGTNPVTYTSRDPFCTLKTAKKQAAWWRSESLELGYICNC